MWPARRYRKGPEMEPTEFDPLLDTHGAASYLRTTPKALQHLVSRKRLIPDVRGGRGAFRSHRFRLSTLNRFRHNA